MRKVFMITALIILCLTMMAQRPYNTGETVLPQDNLSWTDNTGYSTNIFDEILVNRKVVVIFWGGSG